MPQTKATISEMLSDEYKAVLDDPKYAQPRKPLSGIYKPSSTPAAALFAAADVDATHASVVWQLVPE